MIKIVVRGEMVVRVADENGNLMPEYEGPYGKVRKRIKKDAPSQALFFDDIHVAPVFRKEW